MNGYLMQDLSFVRGNDLFIESFSPENRYGVVFEDDGETGYFYAVEKDQEGQGMKVLDALHIYEVDADEVDGNVKTPADSPGSASTTNDSNPADSPNAGTTPAAANGSASRLLIVWSKDWQKCALIIDGFCHAIFDFKVHGGYNINEFPPPNEIWTKGERKLTDEMVRSLL